MMSILMTTQDNNDGTAQLHILSWPLGQISHNEVERETKPSFVLSFKFRFITNLSLYIYMYVFVYVPN